MDQRILRLLINDDEYVDGSPARNGALAYFRDVLSAAARDGTPERLLAKSRLDFFCGHIDEMRGLGSFVPVDAVAAHYSALHPIGGTQPAFVSDLAAYLTLLNVEFRNGVSEFRGASVALTFDGARHARSMLRFADDGQAVSRVLKKEARRGRGR